MVTDSLGVSASKQFLIDAVHGERADSRDAGAGLRGLGPGQLEAELRLGVWIPVDLDARVLFDTVPEKRWSAALAVLGIHPASLAAHADRAGLNRRAASRYLARLGRGSRGRRLLLRRRSARLLGTWLRPRPWARWVPGVASEGERSLPKRWARGSRRRVAETSRPRACRSRARPSRRSSCARLSPALGGSCLGSPARRPSRGSRSPRCSPGRPRRR